MTTRHNSPADQAASTRFIFLLLLLAIFLTEMAVMQIFSPLFSRMGPVKGSLVNAVVLTLVSAFPSWILIIQPLYGDADPAVGAPRPSAGILLVKCLSCIFAAEFLVMLAVTTALPSVDVTVRNLLDSCISSILCVLLLLRVLPREQRRNVDVLADLVGTPVKLYIMLLCAVFLVDMLETPLNIFLAGELHVSGQLIDAVLTTCTLSPVLWLLVVRPLQRTALFEGSRASIVRNQVVDAVVTLSRDGTIESFNPAAEEIFGYRSGEIVGKSVAVLFHNHPGFSDMMEHLHSADSSSSIPRPRHEAACRRSDGSPLTMEISLSRVFIAGREQILAIMRDISSRKKIEEALRESQERFDIAVNGANDGIWDWNIRTGGAYTSPRLRELLGYEDEPPESVIGSFADLLHPDDRERVMAAMRDHLRARARYDIEFRLQCRSGEYRWFRSRGRAVWDTAGRAIRMAGSISDITRYKESTEALHQSEARFRQIFEQSEDAIIFFKPGSCSIIDVNQTAEVLYGFTGAELKNRGIDCFCRPEDRGRFSSIICSIMTNEMHHIDKMVNVRKDGTEIIVSVRGKTITVQGVNVIFCTVRDITERIRMEEEARNIQAKLIQANKMTSLGLLVSGVAHEINNPNNFILANSQIFAKAWKDALKILEDFYRVNGDFQLGGIPYSAFAENSPQLLAGITDGSRRINEIVNSLKKYARDDRSLADTRVDVNQVVVSAATIIHYQLVKHTERFYLELGESIPRIRGSSQQLVQVVINLLMNACQAIQDKRCGIWAATGFDPDAGEVTITVRDEGQGISDNVKKRILEPFFTTKVDSGGTGLGLFISQSIIKEHGGSLEFESVAGQGTTFVVRIPAADLPQRSVPRETVG